MADYTFGLIGCIVGIIGVMFAAFTAYSNRKDKHGEDVEKNTKIHSTLQSQIDMINATWISRLDQIDDGIRDLKAENRGVRGEITKLRDDLRDEIREIHDEARHAIELAEAAHRRLDRIKAPEDSKVTK